MMKSEDVFDMEMAHKQKRACLTPGMDGCGTIRAIRRISARWYASAAQTRARTNERSV